MKIRGPISCHWVPARSRVPAGEWHKRSRKTRIDVDPGAAFGPAVHDIGQAVVPNTVDERVQEPERSLAVDDSITVEVRHNRCKGRRRRTGKNRLAGVTRAQLIHLTWSHRRGFQSRGQRQRNGKIGQQRQGIHGQQDCRGLSRYLRGSPSTWSPQPPGTRVEGTDRRSLRRKTRWHVRAARDRYRRLMSRKDMPPERWVGSE